MTSVLDIISLCVRKEMLFYNLKRIFSFILLVLFIVSPTKPLIASCFDSLEELPRSKRKWIALFDGRTLDGWHYFNNKSEIRNWTIVDGALVCLGAKGPSGSGDIITDQKFRDFELRWDWKVEKGSNSGVFYHVVEDSKYKRAIETAPEYQIIDDIGYPAKLEASQLTGANYGMHTPEEGKILRQVGQWNSSKIIFKKGNVRHWLNGKRIVKFKVLSDDWKYRKATGKWKDSPDYGTSFEGNIGLQDHGNKAYFKNIQIREL